MTKLERCVLIGWVITIMVLVVVTIDCISAGHDVIYINRRAHNRRVVDSVAQERVETCGKR